MLLDLFILFAASLAGTGVIYLMIRSTGRGKDTQISDWSFAATRFSEDHPDLSINKGIVSGNKRAALLSLKHNQEPEFGLVTVLGDMLVPRLIKKDRTKVTQVESGLLFQLNDPTIPKQTIALSPNEAKLWLNIYQEFSEA